jgi:hypothetical protein
MSITDANEIECSTTRKGETMLKRFLVALTVTGLLAGGAAVASEQFGWNPEKGKKLFVAKVKKHVCKKKLSIKGFTQAHTQKEWKEIIENGKFEEEFQNMNYG